MTKAKALTTWLRIGTHYTAMRLGGYYMSDFENQNDDVQLVLASEPTYPANTFLTSMFIACSKTGK